MKTSGDALLSLIDEILDFSKIEAGRLDLDARPFDLRALIEDIVELLAPRAQAKGIEIAACRRAAAAPVIGDAARLRQVLLNLAGNAIKFTETRRRLDRGRARHGRTTFLPVRDTGIGIAPTEHERIFREFEQADGGTARKAAPGSVSRSPSASSTHGRPDRRSTARPAPAPPFAFTVPLPPRRR